MTSWRPRVVVLALWLLALAACKKEGELPPEFGRRGPAVDVGKLEAPALFAHIPADTPYVFASFEADALEYFAKMRRVLGPAVARNLDKLRALAPGSSFDHWINAIIEELDGKWTAKGLESLGLSAKPRFALYGHGAAPIVLRLEVRNDKAVLETLERIAHRAGAKLPALENRHGREFWRIELPGEAGAIVSLNDNQLVAAFGPRHTIAAVLPQIVGAEKPRRSMADGKQLKDVIAKHRLGPQLIGYVDWKRLATELIALAERTPSQECSAEIDRLAARVPRLVVSYTEISDKRQSGGVILELAPAVAEQLQGLRAAVPGLAAALADDPMIAFGFGVDLERAQAAGKAVAAVMRELGEACEAEELVRGGRKLRTALSGSIPGVVAKLAGGAIAIDALELEQGRRSYGPPLPREIDGFAMLAAANAKALLAAVADEAPPVRALGLEPDGKLRALDADALGLPFKLHGGVGAEVAAVAVGARGKKRAEKALAATGGGKGPLLAGTFDTAKLIELQTQLGMSEDLTRDLDEGLANLFGRSTFSVEATAAGLAIWFSTEVK